MSSTVGVGLAQDPSSAAPAVAPNPSQPSAKPKLTKTQRRRNRKKRNRGRKRTQFLTQSSLQELPGGFWGTYRERDNVPIHLTSGHLKRDPTSSVGVNASSDVNVAGVVPAPVDASSSSPRTFRASRRTFTSDAVTRSDFEVTESALAVASSCLTPVSGPSSSVASARLAMSDSGSEASDNSSAASNHPANRVRRTPFWLRPTPTQVHKRLPALLEKHQIRPPKCHPRDPMASDIADLWAKAQPVMRVQELIELRDYIELSVKHDRKRAKRGRPSWFEKREASSNHEDVDNDKDVPLRRKRRRLNAQAMAAVSDNEDEDDLSAEGGDEGDMEDHVYEKVWSYSDRLAKDTFYGCDRGAWWAPREVDTTDYTQVEHVMQNPAYVRNIPLMDFPAEILQEILMYLVCAPDTIKPAELCSQRQQRNNDSLSSDRDDVTSNSSFRERTRSVRSEQQQPPVVRTCRVLREMGLPLYYRQNHFSIIDSEVGPIQAWPQDRYPITETMPRPHMYLENMRSIQLMMPFEWTEVQLLEGRCPMHGQQRMKKNRPSVRVALKIRKQGGMELCVEEKNLNKTIPWLDGLNKDLALVKMERGYWDNRWGFKLLKTAGLMKFGLNHGFWTRYVTQLQLEAL